MNLSRLFRNVFIIIVMFILVLGVLAFLMLGNYVADEQYESDHYELLSLINEMQRGFDGLTKYSRMYVSTGENLWLKKYDEVFDIWTKDKPGPDELQDSLIRISFAVREIELLKKAEIDLDELIEKQRAAISAASGFYADENGSYTIKREPDPEEARRIIFGKDYCTAEENLKTSIEGLVEKISKQTITDLGNHDFISHLLVRIVIGVIIFLLIILLVTYLILKDKLIKENEELEKVYKIVEESEHRYRTLFDNSPDAYLIITNGVFTHYNKAALEKLGSELYIKGKTPNDISPEYQPDGRTTKEVGEEKIRNTLEKGCTTFEWIHKRENGKELYSEVSLVSIKLHGEPVLFASWRDITQRKKIEKELKDSERRLRIAQAIGKMGSWEMDLATWKVTGSEQAAKFFGFDTPHDHELPFVVTNERTLPQYRAMIKESLRKLIEENKEYNIEYQFRRLNTDEVVWAHSKAELDYDEQAKPKKIIGIVQDITERKKDEQDLKESEANLRDLNATKDKFFSIIAHDLKGPFSALLNFSKILIEEYEELSEDERISFIQSVEEISSNAYKLLENLLEWSRLQVGKMSFIPEKLNMYAAVLPSLRLLEQAAHNKEIKLNYAINHSYQIIADKNMLDTIVRNLVSNAIKFTKPGGNVSLEVNKTANYYEISVTDDGVGISSDNLDRLFRIDKNVSTKGTANEEGTGLGLLLCKEMVEMHGGKIWVESEEGKGTTFRFTIP